MNSDFALCKSSNVIFATYGKTWMFNALPEAFAKQLGKMAATMPAQGWAFYDDIRNWPIKVPEDMAFCATCADDFAQQGLTHCVICTGDLAISRWMMKKIIPKNVKLTFFDNLEECERFLVNQGFDTQFKSDVPAI